MKKLLLLLFLFPSMITAQGECTSGDCDGGQGVMTFEDGSVYQGGFKFSKPHGEGSLKTADGYTEKGKFFIGKKDGSIKIYKDDFYLGNMIYDNGELNEELAYYSAMVEKKKKGLNLIEGLDCRGNKGVSGQKIKEILELVHASSLNAVLSVPPGAVASFDCDQLQLVFTQYMSFRSIEMTVDYEFGLDDIESVTMDSDLLENYDTIEIKFKSYIKSTAHVKDRDYPNEPERDTLDFTLVLEVEKAKRLFELLQSLI